MEIIYAVEHWCGFGPYSTSFHKTLDGAKKQAEKYLKAEKKKDHYISRTMKESKPWNFELEKDKPRELFRWHWQTEGESNNENGHEYWENDEYLSVKEAFLYE